MLPIVAKRGYKISVDEYSEDEYDEEVDDDIL
jgi:hypothetical protein